MTPPAARRNSNTHHPGKHQATILANTPATATAQRRRYETLFPADAHTTPLRGRAHSHPPSPHTQRGGPIPGQWAGSASQQALPLPPHHPDRGYAINPSAPKADPNRPAQHCTLPEPHSLLLLPSLNPTTTQQPTPRYNRDAPTRNSSKPLLVTPKTSFHTATTSLRRNDEHVSRNSGRQLLPRRTSKDLPPVELSKRPEHPRPVQARHTHQEGFSRWSKDIHPVPVFPRIPTIPVLVR